MDLLKKIFLLVAVALFALPAFAVPGPDLTPLTSVVNFDTVITALLAIAGLLAAVYVAIRGAKTVLGMIKGS